MFLLQGFGVLGVVLDWILGDLLGVAAYSISVLRSGALGSVVFNLKGTLSKLLRLSFPLYLASVVSFLYSYYDRVVVLAFLPLSDVGVYDVAYGLQRSRSIRRSFFLSPIPLLWFSIR